MGVALHIHSATFHRGGVNLCMLLGKVYEDWANFNRVQTNRLGFAAVVQLQASQHNSGKFSFVGLQIKTGVVDVQFPELGSSTGTMWLGGHVEITHLSIDVVDQYFGLRSLIGLGGTIGRGGFIGLRRGCCFLQVHIKVQCQVGATSGRCCGQKRCQ